MDFIITKLNPDDFSRLVYTLPEFGKDVTFEVVSSSTFAGIRFTMTNNSLVYMLKAKLAAQVKLPEGTKSLMFTVETSDLKKVFKAARGQTMKILRKKDDDHITFSFGKSCQDFRLRALRSDNKPGRLQNIVTDHIIHIRVEELKKYCRTVGRFGSENLTIEIWSRPPAADGTVTTYTSLECETESKGHRVTYKQTTKENADGSIHFVCDPSTDTEEDEENFMYSGEFQVGVIGRFLKNFKKGIVWVALATLDDGSPGPMIIHCGFGCGDDSYIRLVQASIQRADDDDEETSPPRKRARRGKTSADE